MRKQALTPLHGREFMEMRSFGDLSGPFIPPARGGQASSMIILLHGWGADGNDLANLAYPQRLRFWRNICQLRTIA